MMVSKKEDLKSQKGSTLLELLIVLALIGIFLLALSADLSGSVRRKDFELFAREVTVLMERSRWKALNERRNAGVVFGIQNGIYQAAIHVDGNNNGIRTAEVRTGIDPIIDPPVFLTRSSGDIHAGILSSTIPQIPPRPGFIDQPDDPVKFGRSDIVSFSPMGDSSSGTLYLACKSQKQMYAIVLFGATARISIWRFSNYQWQMVGDR
jgi:prepilin-type N-terminal cleavage/methylation domain-containing protein